MTHPTDLVLRRSVDVSNDELNALFDAAWPGHSSRDFSPVLRRSLAAICAYLDERLVGFVNVTWDGGRHAFVLDTTVHPDHQRCGIGRRLVAEAVSVARAHGVEWVHVDYEPHLAMFYERCGFRPTSAGLYHVKEREGAA